MKLSTLIAPLFEARALLDQCLALVLAFVAQLDDTPAPAVAVVEQWRAMVRARIQHWRELQGHNVTERSVTDSCPLARAEEGSSGRVTAPHQTDVGEWQERIVTERCVTDGNGLPCAVERNSNLDVDPQDKDVRQAHFSRFSSAYPHKVGMRKARTTFKVWTILSGLGRHIRGKPPDRAWLNPRPFHQERSADQPATPPSSTSSPRPAAQPNPVRAVIAGLREHVHERARGIGSDRSAAVGLPGGHSRGRSRTGDPEPPAPRAALGAVRRDGRCPCTACGSPLSEAHHSNGYNEAHWPVVE